MKDFEDKYSLLIKYMLPSVHRCIDKVEFDRFVLGPELLGIVTNPKDDYEVEKYNNLITPKIKVSLKKGCNNLRGIDKLGIEGDIMGKLEEIYSTFFGDQKFELNTNSRYIDFVPHL